MDSLSEDGATFLRAFSCANMTDPSLTSILTGEHPVSHGIITHGQSIIHYRKESSMLITLPQILKSMGYLTFGIDWLGKWYRKGFDFYSGLIQKSISYRFIRKTLQYLPLNLKRLMEKTTRILYAPLYKAPFPTADIHTSLASSIIEKFSDNPFFLFIHYWDTHLPYVEEKPFIDRARSHLQKCNKDLTSFEEIVQKVCNPFFKNIFIQYAKRGLTPLDLIARYYGAISYVDSKIGELIKTLHQCGIFNKSIIIVTSDHGESLGEHGIYFDHAGLYDVTTHIPLIIRRHTLPSRKINGLVQHTDIAPTILDIIGESKTLINSFNGKSLLPLIFQEKKEHRDFIVVYESSWLSGERVALRTSEHKLIKDAHEQKAYCSLYKHKHFPSIEFYDLKDDPYETKNLADKFPELVRKYSQNIEHYIYSQRSSVMRLRTIRKIKLIKSRELKNSGYEDAI